MFNYIILALRYNLIYNYIFKLNPNQILSIYSIHIYTCYIVQVQKMIFSENLAGQFILSERSNRKITIQFSYCFFHPIANYPVGISEKIIFRTLFPVRSYTQQVNKPSFKPLIKITHFSQRVIFVSAKTSKCCNNITRIKCDRFVFVFK